MNKFSEKSILALGENYVYGLIDPRTNKFFYIGKGTNNRVFEHEAESIKNPKSEKLKLKTIAEIKEANLEVKKVIINSNLSENEAFASEASLINAFNYVENTNLTNIESGHHAQEEAMTVKDFERCNGAIELDEKDIKHKIVAIKVNKLYKRGMSDKDLYDAVRGIWRINIQKAKKAEYVFGLYHSLIVAVYKPSKWIVCKDDKDNIRPRKEVITEKNKNRKFFIDEDYESGKDMDDIEKFYIYKSVTNFKKLHKSQNSINYIYPIQ